MSERQTPESGLPPERYDDPWDFTVTWSEGVLPNPVLWLFRHRSTVERGRAVHHTDKGHATYYVEAVNRWLAKYRPERTDILASATRVIPSGSDHPEDGPR